MKIDAALVSVERDTSPKAAAGADGERDAMGDAFGKAVKDAGGQKPAAKQDKPAKAEASAPVSEKKGADEGEADAGALEAADTEAETASLATLLGVLGVLGGLAVQKGAAKEAGKPNASAAEEQDVSAPASLRDPKEALDALAADGAGPKGKRSVQLDVVRMETHFEPRQDGMLLVEGALDGDAVGLDAKTQAGPQAELGVASTLANLVKGKSADAAAVPAASKTSGRETTANDDQALPPISFDEALARLGQGGGSERSGQESNRDGSASARASLADLSAARNAARNVDGAAASAGAELSFPSSSPYNLAGQVARPIMDALGDPGRSAAQSSSPSSDAHLRMRAGGGALKTLTIQLHPEHLGTVDVSMRLNEGRLTLELAASRSDTASMLLNDQASLRKLLEHAGFSLDDAAISVVTRDSGQIRTADSGATNAQQQRDSSGNGADDGRSNARGQPGTPDDQSGRRRGSSRSSDEPPSAPKRTSATYL